MKRENRVEIKFTDKELTDLEAICEILSVNRSNFIREAIKDKIRRIKNPPDVKVSINSKTIEKATYEGMKKLFFESLKPISQKLDTVENTLKDTTKAIFPYRQMRDKMKMIDLVKAGVVKVDPKTGESKLITKVGDKPL